MSSAVISTNYDFDSVCQNQVFSSASQFAAALPQFPEALPLEKKAVGSPVANRTSSTSSYPSTTGRTISPGVCIPSEQQWLYQAQQQQQQQQPPSASSPSRQLSPRCSFTRSTSCTVARTSSPGKFSCSGLMSVDEQQWELQSQVLSQRKLDRSLSEPIDFRQQQQQPKGPNINSSRYKTELCRPFEENGKCKYGDKCQFAHGAPELRIVARHPKYKTELCRSYHTIGICRYGMRCHFIHEDERKLMNYFQQKQQMAVKEAAEQIVESLKIQERHSSSGSSSRPAPIQRPKALAYVRETMGSTADSPPDSMASDSPQSLSPISYADHEVFMSLSAFGSTTLTPPPSTGVFQLLSDDSCSPTPIAKPLNVQTSGNAQTCLAAGLQAALRVQCDHHTYPSPPDSVNGDSEVDGLTSGMRLPVFSGLSDY